MSDDNGALRVYSVDDELLALKRLNKLLATIEGVKIVGGATSPSAALEFLQTEEVDVLFLDIQMPGMNGFELLAKLRRHPLIVFTTAYDQFALKAFEVNSIDYLLKPIEPEHLERALRKVACLRETAQTLEARAQLQSLMLALAEKFPSPSAARETPSRISTRVGSRILFVDLDRITHFYADNKLTFAATAEAKKYVVDYSIEELERKFDSAGFVRIHRATLVNLSYVDELYRWFAGGMRIRVKDKNRTELTVSRDRAANLKKRLGLETK